MPTIRDVIERAYRKLGVVPEDEPLTADQAANGLFAFNAMMHGFAARGANTLHTDQTLDGTFSLPARLLEAVIYCLAERMAPDNMTPAPDAREYQDVIKAYFLEIPTAEVPTALRQRRGWGWL